MTVIEGIIGGARAAPPLSPASPQPMTSQSVLTAIERSIRRLSLAGGLAAALLTLGAGSFAFLVPLASAVIASGRLVVESTVKTVQHQEGGIVAEIPVEEGQRVKAGTLLLRLDGTAARATLGVIEVQIEQLEARLARLEAERDGAPELVMAPPITDLDDEDQARRAQIFAGERRLLAARRDALDGQKAQLRQRIEQMTQAITGLEAQQDGRRKELAVVGTEQIGVEQLFQAKLVTAARVHELQRDHARLEADIGALTAQIAEARDKIAETQTALLSLDQQRLSDVMKELRDTQSSLAPLYERRAAAVDQLNRLRIIAPVDGIVHELATHTIGGVIAPREVVMKIVPGDDPLILKVGVRPQDIDKVHVGDAVRIRLLAGNLRTTPEFHGHVKEVSADVVTDERDQKARYIAQIEPDRQEIAAFDDFAMLPGMPAEAFIDQGQRTTFDYLVKPIRDVLSHAFKEH